MNKTKSIYLALLAVLLSPMAANATLINFDFNGIGDDYATGAAVFGSAGSQWNLASRFSNHVNLALFDETGGATTVTVSTGRINSSSYNPPAGAFADLGSSFQTSTLVMLAGLIPNASYDLVIIANSAFGGSMNALTEGTNYTRSLGLVATAGGMISFVPTGFNPGFDAGNSFSGFQLRTAQVSVPEPGTLALLGLGLAGMGMTRRKKKV